MKSMFMKMHAKSVAGKNISKELISYSIEQQAKS